MKPPSFCTNLNHTCLGFWLAALHHLVKCSTMYLDVVNLGKSSIWITSKIQPTAVLTWLPTNTSVCREGVSYLPIVLNEMQQQFNK